MLTSDGIDPTGETSSDKLNTWLFTPHMAGMGGPFRLCIAVLGLAVAVLSVIGVVI